MKAAPPHPAAKGQAVAPVRHVLLTADAVGGVWTYALDLAAGLAARGVRTTLAVLGPAPSAEEAAAARAIPGLHLVVTGLPLDWTAETRRELKRSADALARLAADAGVDLIHLNSPALAGLAPWPAPVVGACHSCLSSWLSAVPSSEPPEGLTWRTRVLKAGYAACDALLAPTAAFARETERLYGVRPAVALNGRRAPAAGAETPRKAQVVTTGRLWDVGKSVDALDRAAAGLGAPVLALGALQGPVGGAASFAHLVTPGRVSAERVAAALRESAVFCSLARYEPFGLGVLEAAQAGCALVLSPIPTFRELWDGAAVFVDPADTEAVRAALRRLLDDPAAARALGEAARIRAARYSVEAMTAATLATYAGACTAEQLARRAPARREAVA